MITVEELRERLRAKVEEVGGQGAAAAQAHVTRQYLNSVLKGRDLPGYKLAKWLGLRRVYTYEPIIE